jgi:hypothetical protein
MNTKKLVAGVLLTLLSPAALPLMIAGEEFNYAAGGLNGQNGGTGWGGAWTANLGPANLAVVDPAVDLSGDRALLFSGANHNDAAFRPLASAYSGNELFLSFEFRVIGGTLADNDFLALWLNSLGGPNMGIKADEGGTPGPLKNDVFVRTTGVAGSFVQPSILANNTTHQLVARVSKNNSTHYNKIEGWLDPLLADFGSPEATFNGDSNMTSITQVGFRTANLDPDDKVLVDQLRIGTTWNDVAGPNVDAADVPEPAGFALFGLGLFLAGFVRSRRRS